MKALKTFLVITATMIVAVAAPLAQASNPSPAQLRGLEIAGQAMNTRCQTSILSREGYVALCGTRGARHQPTATELRAYEIRGRAMNAMHKPAVSGSTAAALRALAIRGQGMANLSNSSTLSREGYVALFGAKGAEHQPTASQLKALEIRGQALNTLAAEATTGVVPSTGFNWSYFGIGAAAFLGAMLLTGGIWAGIHFGRKPGAPPHTVS